MNTSQRCRNSCDISFPESDEVEVSAKSGCVITTNGDEPITDARENNLAVSNDEHETSWTYINYENNENDDNNNCDVIDDSEELINIDLDKDVSKLMNVFNEVKNAKPSREYKHMLFPPPTKYGPIFPRLDICNSVRFCIFFPLIFIFEILYAVFVGSVEGIIEYILDFFYSIIQFISLYSLTLPLLCCCSMYCFYKASILNM